MGLAEDWGWGALVDLGARLWGFVGLDWFGLGKDGNAVCAFDGLNAHSWSNDLFRLSVLNPNVAWSDDTFFCFSPARLEIYLDFIGNKLALPFRLDWSLRNWNDFLLIGQGFHNLLRDLKRLLLSKGTFPQDLMANRWLALDLKLFLFFLKIICEGILILLLLDNRTQELFSLWAKQLDLAFCIFGDGKLGVPTLIFLE